MLSFVSILKTNYLYQQCFIEEVDEYTVPGLILLEAAASLLQLFLFGGC